MRKFFSIILAVIVAGVLGFLLWAYWAPQAGPSAQAAMQSQSVKISQEKGIIFAPKSEVKAGFIFYQGARVRPESYAMEMVAIAEAGYLVFVPQMPLNFAIFGPDKAEEIINSHPEIDHWVIGGHSLGGAMAGRFTYKHPDLVDGVIFWASYPPKSNNLINWARPVTSISGSLDGLASPDKIEASKETLPPNTHYIVIEGGNHAQFGDYGKQSGDNEASIPAQEQWSQIVNATLEALGD